MASIIFYLFLCGSCCKKRYEKRCQIIRRFKTCHKHWLPNRLNNKDIEAMKNKAFSIVNSKVNVQFSNSVDETNKELFYTQFPLFRK
jgi:hypothetical protein